MLLDSICNSKPDCKLLGMLLSEFPYFSKVMIAAESISSNDLPKQFQTWSKQVFTKESAAQKLKTLGDEHKRPFSQQP